MNIKLNDSKIKPIGRYAYDGDSLKGECTGAGFEFHANLKSDVIVKCKFVNYAEVEDVHIGVMVDNNYDDMKNFLVPLDATEFTALSGVTGEHIVKIVKLNEFNRNGVCFDSIEFDGELLDRPADKPLKFEFYGDSLTCGYGNLHPNRNHPSPFNNYEHGYRTFASLLCNHFNAEMTVAAASGYGIFKDCEGTDRIWADFYDKALPKEGVEWNFDNYKADAVFINLGSNDWNFTQNHDATISTDDMFANAKKIIDDIRAKNPDCKLIFNYGINDYPLKNQKIDIPSLYERLNETYENSYVVKELQCNQLGGDWHPNVNDHYTAFSKFLCRLKDLKVEF